MGRENLQTVKYLVKLYVLIVHVTQKLFLLSYHK